MVIDIDLSRDGIGTKVRNLVRPGDPNYLDSKLVRIPGGEGKTFSSNASVGSLLAQVEPNDTTIALTAIADATPVSMRSIIHRSLVTYAEKLGKLTRSSDSALSSVVFSGKELLAGLVQGYLPLEISPVAAKIMPTSMLGDAYRLLQQPMAA